MKRGLIIGLTLIVLIALYRIYHDEDNSETPETVSEETLKPTNGAIEVKSDEVTAVVVHGVSINQDVPPAPFMDNYGSPEYTLKDDLDSVSLSLQNYWLLLKDIDDLNVMSNETIVRELTGQNKKGLQFISKSHPYINEEGELLDRYGKPLIFHALAVWRIEIRSAGPDGKAYTEDDVIVTVVSNIQ